MKHNGILRLMALMLALLLAAPTLALAEEEIITGMVEEAVPAEIDVDLGAAEIVEAPAEEPIVESLEEPAGDQTGTIAMEPVEGIVGLSDRAPETVGPLAAQEFTVYNAPALLAAESAPAPQNYTVDTPISKNTAWTLNVGDTLQLTMADEVKSYKCSKKSVASVTAEGLVTALKAGKVKVTATISKKKKIVVTVTVKDPYAPTGVSVSAPGAPLYLGMGTPKLTATLEPAYAKSAIKWKSSDKKVCKVGSDGTLTPVKAGKAKITAVTANKKKATVSVTVKKNIVDGINAKPSKALIKSIGKNWTIGPKSVERTASGSYVCKFYLLNGVGKSKRINNLGLELYVNGNKIAGKTWSKVNVVCAKGSSKLFKLTYSGNDVLVKDAILLSGLSTDNIYFKMTTAPTLTYRVS